MFGLLWLFCYCCFLLLLLARPPVQAFVDGAFIVNVSNVFNVNVAAVASVHVVLAVAFLAIIAVAITAATSSVVAMLLLMLFLQLSADPNADIAGIEDKLGQLLRDVSSVREGGGAGFANVASQMDKKFSETEKKVRSCQMLVNVRIELVFFSLATLAPS